MIEFLRIKNLAVVEEAELELGEGFVALTGETGAGKSIIVGSLKALVGGKPDPDSIRTGKEKARIEVMVEGRILTLEIGKKRSRALLDGQMVPLKKLSQEASRYIDIFGQRDHYFLLEPERHLEFLDAYIGAMSLREKVLRAWEEFQDSLRKLREAEERREEVERERELLGFQIQEIERANIKPGEDLELDKKREFLLRKERLKEALLRVNGEMEGEGGVYERLWEVKKALEELGGAFPEFNPHLEDVQNFLSALSDLARLVGEKLAYIEEEDISLEEVEERLALLERLKRKYGPTLEEVISYRKKAEEKLALLERSFDLAGLREQVKRTKEEFLELAKQLSEKRKKGKEKLEKELISRLKKLALERARMELRLREVPPYACGLEEGEFYFSANPGEELKPLRKIASGGELSRVMLALKSLFAERGKTFVFDEIDTGIGGRTSFELGKMLRELARTNQIIVVTHLPQVAAFAEQHFLVEKEVRGGRTYTKVRELSPDERLRELARMLSGKVTPSSLENAKELMERVTS